MYQRVRGIKELKEIITKLNYTQVLKLVFVFLNDVDDIITKHIQQLQYAKKKIMLHNTPCSDSFSILHQHILIKQSIQLIICLSLTS